VDRIASGSLNGDLVSLTPWHDDGKKKSGLLDTFKRLSKWTTGSASKQSLPSHVAADEAVEDQLEDEGVALELDFNAMAPACDGHPSPRELIQIPVAASSAPLPNDSSKCTVMKEQYNDIKSELSMAEGVLQPENSRRAPQSSSRLARDNTVRTPSSTAARAKLEFDFSPERPTAPPAADSAAERSATAPATKSPTQSILQSRTAEGELARRTPSQLVSEWLEATTAPPQKPTTSLESPHSTTQPSHQLRDTPLPSTPTVPDALASSAKEQPPPPWLVVPQVRRPLRPLDFHTFAAPGQANLKLGGRWGKDFNDAWARVSVTGSRSRPTKTIGCWRRSTVLAFRWQPRRRRPP
jgi:hypothetical protein